MTARIINGISNGIAALRSDRARYQSGQMNEQFRQAEENNFNRAVVVHGASAVAEVARRFPATFTAHNCTEEKSE